MIRQQRLRPQEYGGVLVIGLLTLVLLTALGIAATTSSVMENDIAGNERTHKEAFYAAELALEIAENKMRYTKEEDFNPGNIRGHYVKDDPILQQPGWKTMRWDASDTQEIALNPTKIAQKSAVPPRYASERDIDPDSWGIGIGVPTEVLFFRMTARGTGSRAAAQVFVNSRYAWRLREE